jgi:hypothetical protein
MQIHIFERFPVIHIARGKNKVQKFSFIVDNQVKFETIEPADGILSFPGDILECFMLFLSFYVTTAKRGGVDKRYPRTLARAHHLDEDRQRHTNFALQFHETIIEYCVREIFPHILSDVKEIKTFQVLECPAVEQNKDSHYFTLKRRLFAVLFPCFCILQRVIPNELIKFFERFVNDEINFCNFMVGNHRGIISK